MIVGDLAVWTPGEYRGVSRRPHRNPIFGWLLWRQWWWWNMLTKLKNWNKFRSRPILEERCDKVENEPIRGGAADQNGEHCGEISRQFESCWFYSSFQSRALSGPIFLQTNLFEAARHLSDCPPTPLVRPFTDRHTVNRRVQIKYKAWTDQMWYVKPTNMKWKVLKITFYF